MAGLEQVASRRYLAVTDSARGGGVASPLPQPWRSGAMRSASHVTRTKSDSTTLRLLRGYTLDGMSEYFQRISCLLSAYSMT